MSRGFKFYSIYFVFFFVTREANSGYILVVVADLLDYSPEASRRSQAGALIVGFATQLLF